MLAELTEEEEREVCAENSGNSWINYETLGDRKGAMENLAGIVSFLTFSFRQISTQPLRSPLKCQVPQPACPLCRHLVWNFTVALETLVIRHFVCLLSLISPDSILSGVSQGAHSHAHMYTYVHMSTHTYMCVSECVHKILAANMYLCMYVSQNVCIKYPTDNLLLVH